jgi:hypothetical protein
MQVKVRRRKVFGKNNPDALLILPKNTFNSAIAPVPSRSL